MGLHRWLWSCEYKHQWHLSYRKAKRLSRVYEFIEQERLQCHERKSLFTGSQGEKIALRSASARVK